MSWSGSACGRRADSGLALLGDALTSGRLEAPADGKVSWTAHLDLATAAASILTDAAGRFAGPTPPLTGSEALDLADLAALASELAARPIHRTVICDDEQRARLATRGAARAAPIVLGLYLASRAGEFSRVDSTLEQLLGRPPTRIRELLADRRSSATRVSTTTAADR